MYIAKREREREGETEGCSVLQLSVVEGEQGRLETEEVCVVQRLVVGKTVLHSNSCPELQKHKFVQRGEETEHKGRGHY